MPDAPPQALDRLRRRVDECRAQWPSESADRLHCIVLFGSRARGDHRPWSDWDLCALWNGAPPDHATPSHHDGHAIEWIDYDKRTFDAERRRIGTVAREIAAHGVTLHGADIQRTVSGGLLPMNHDDWMNHFRRLGKEASRIARETKNYKKRPHRTNGELCGGSANFAEFVAKTILDFNGIQPRRRHDVTLLAAQLPDDDPYKESLEEIGRGTDTDHSLRYVKVTRRDGTNDNIRALARSSMAFELLARVLEPEERNRFGISSGDLTEAEREDIGDVASEAMETWQEDVIGEFAKIDDEGFIGEQVESILRSARRIALHAQEIATEIDIRGKARRLSR